MMKELRINLLQTNPFSNESLEVTEYIFWKNYLELLQIKVNRFLGDSEIKVLAYVLAGDINKSYFKRPNSKEIEKEFGFTNNNLHQIKTKLESKGIIVKTEIPGDYILTNAWSKFQKDIKNKIKEGIRINFEFKMKVE